LLAELLGRLLAELLLGRLLAELLLGRLLSTELLARLLLAELLLRRLLLVVLLLGRLLSTELLARLLLGRLLALLTGLAHLLALWLELPGLWVPLGHLLLLLALGLLRYLLGCHALWGLCGLLLRETALLNGLRGLGVTGLVPGLDASVPAERLVLAVSLCDATLALLAVLLGGLLAVLLLPLLLISLVVHCSIAGVRR